MDEQQVVIVLRVLFTVAVTWYFVQVVADWFIFKKAGIAGWKSLIPFYRTYLLYKICWVGVWYWIELIIACVGSYLYSMNLQETTALGSVGLFLMLFATLIMASFCIKLSYCFGHGMWFGLGLFMLQPIFRLILGLGYSEYLGNMTGKNIISG